MQNTLRNGCVLLLNRLTKPTKYTNVSRASATELSLSPEFEKGGGQNMPSRKKTPMMGARQRCRAVFLLHFKNTF